MAFIFGGGLSNKQARQNRKALLNDIRKDHARKAREAIQRIRAEEKQARADRKAALVAARAACVENAERANKEAKEAHRLAVELSRKARDATRRVARDQCVLDREHARAEGAAKIALKQAERTEEKKFQAELKRLEKSHAQAERDRARESRKHRKSESNDEVRSNIEPHLRPLFERVKGKIKASDRMSRTEAFAHYVEENPGEVSAAQEKEAEKQLRADLREQRKNAPRKPRRIPRSELAPAPF